MFIAQRSRVDFPEADARLDIDMDQRTVPDENLNTWEGGENFSKPDKILVTLAHGFKGGTWDSKYTT